MIALLSVMLSAFADEVTIAKCEYWLDHDFDGRSELPVSPEGVFEHTFDMSGEEAGLHALALRFCDSKGLWTSPVLRHFVKVREEKSVNSSLSEFIYWLDYDKEHAVKSSCADGFVEMSLDVSVMSPGLHAMTYMVSENNGLYSSAVTRYFIVPHKAPKEGKMIAGYEYWFNYDAPVYVAVTPSPVVELTDVTIDAINVQPMAIPDDYIFDVEALTVTCPESDLFFGMQVIDDAGGRSGAVVSDTVVMDLTVKPAFVDIAEDEPLTFASPVDGKIAGVRAEALPGDKLTFRIDGGKVHADFYDGAGNRLSPSGTRDGDAMTYEIECVVPMVYLLLHSAADRMAVTEVSLDRVTSGLDEDAYATTGIAVVDGGIMVECGEEISLTIYSLSGMKLLDRGVAPGKTLINIASGCYVVTATDGTVTRVMVR